MAHFTEQSILNPVSNLNMVNIDGSGQMENIL